jgi:hypothetical protein
MTLRKWTAVVVLTGIAAALALPAEAAKKRKPSHIYYGSEDRYYGPNGRPGRSVTPTRLTVRPRSYLDPGTETKQYDQHYTDYAFPPGGSWSYRNRNDYNMSFSRQPLPDPWDIPGWQKY